jgi:hypothetical protein
MKDEGSHRLLSHLEYWKSEMMELRTLPTLIISALFSTVI